jgi:hypothetical protein
MDYPEDIFDGLDCQPVSVVAMPTHRKNNHKKTLLELVRIENLDPTDSVSCADESRLPWVFPDLN